MNKFSEHDLKKVIRSPFSLRGNVISLDSAERELDKVTMEAFSEKWTSYNKEENKEPYYEMQRLWYLKLFGFETNEHLALFLKKKNVIIDAGCGLGFKSAWFAEMSPESLVIGVDYSDAIEAAAKNYKHISNLFFLRGDLTKDLFKRESVDYVSCDQVLQHTSDPQSAFKKMSDSLMNNGEFACYVYAKKALPRELIDTYFREATKEFTHSEIKDLSNQLTELGKKLSELNIKITSPDIPLLGIKAGEYDLQRFIYWNFLKCYWNKDLGFETSSMINFDWYSPAQAARFSKEEFLSMVTSNHLTVLSFNEEEACYSGRFLK